MLQFQQRIALLYGTTGFSRDSGIVISIADNERRGHGIELGAYFCSSVCLVK